MIFVTGGLSFARHKMARFNIVFHGGKVSLYTYWYSGVITKSDLDSDWDYRAHYYAIIKMIMPNRVVCNLNLNLGLINGPRITNFLWLLCEEARSRTGYNFPGARGGKDPYEALYATLSRQICACKAKLRTILCFKLPFSVTHQPAH